MNVTLDQARTLDAFAREGTLQAAAKALRKTHPAVVYALKQLETQTGLTLFDRSGYRTRLTPEGQAVLGHCRSMIDAATALETTCAILHSGWEPVLRVVFDAIVPLAPFLETVREVRAAKAPTRVMLSVDSLDGVEARFEAQQAQLMVTLLDVTSRPGQEVHALPKIRARLVAHRSHPLARVAHVTRDMLEEHVLLTVRGSHPALHMATAALDSQSTVHLSDFHAKKAAILEGLGFGWLPEWLAASELKKGELQVVPLTPASATVHVFAPRLVTRGTLGHAGRALVRALRRNAARG